MTFKLIHLLGLKSNFVGIQTPQRKMLKIQKIPPSFSDLLHLIEIVGGDSNWHQRKEYFEEASVQRLKSRIFQRDSSLFLFKNGQQTIGFCQVCGIEALPYQIKVPSNSVFEIYKVGLFPEWCGQGLGRFYVSSVLDHLFQERPAVYLNTRDTNKVNSVSFYKSFGLRVLGSEEMEDDVIDHTGAVPAARSY